MKKIIILLMLFMVGCRTPVPTEGTRFMANGQYNWACSECGEEFQTAHRTRQHIYQEH